MRHGNWASGLPPWRKQQPSRWVEGRLGLCLVGWLWDKFVDAEVGEQASLLGVIVKGSAGGPGGGKGSHE